jgi:hypothetical protein
MPIALFNRLAVPVPIIGAAAAALIRRKRSREQERAGDDC